LPYIPDLVLSDFWLFGRLKASLASRVFVDVDQILETVIAFLNEIQLSELRLVFRH
jgi:hypothetical protein